MSKSRLDEMMELVSELREGGKTLDAAIAETESRLSLLRAVRRAVTVDDAPATVRGKAEWKDPRKEVAHG